MQADALADLPEIIDFAQCPSLMPTLNAVCTDADAAWVAAWVAAKAAAKDAAWVAGWAEDAAEAAAEAAAGAAAWVAAKDAAAAGDALKPTMEALQMSALDLVHRMIAVGTPKEGEA